MLHYRVAQRFLQAFNQVKLEGPEREKHLEAVWAMYRNSYKAIGMSLGSPRDLLKYDVWVLYYNTQKVAVAFSVAKRTKYGLKGGASGHDGSSEGKAAAVKGLRTKFLTQGFYGEVSHKVKDIVLAAGAPVVCAHYVGQILGKAIHPVGALEYSRNLEGVGMVTKVMVGRPNGVPTTDFRNPACPLEEVKTAQEVDFSDDFCDWDSHYASLTH